MGIRDRESKSKFKNCHVKLKKKTSITIQFLVIKKKEFLLKYLALKEAKN